MNKKNIIIIGNWKMNKTILETQKFFLQFNKLYSKESPKINKQIQFGFAVPSISLSIANKNNHNFPIIIAAQNMHHESSGAYTGEVSASMVKSSGANAVVIGHSERRKYFGETNENINKKILLAMKNDLLSILCIGETLEERKSNKWKQSIQKQLDIALKNIELKAFLKIIIAYEPIWAIGTGITASPQEAQEVCKFIRNIIEKKSNSNIASQIVIQYGGSVKPNNIYQLLNQNDINGSLVGGASLEPETFIQLLIESSLKKENSKF